MNDLHFTDDGWDFAEAPFYPLWDFPHDMLELFGTQTDRSDGGIDMPRIFNYLHASLGLFDIEGNLPHHFSRHLPCNGREKFFSSNDEQVNWPPPAWHTYGPAFPNQERMKMEEDFLNSLGDLKQAQKQGGIPFCGLASPEDTESGHDDEFGLNSRRRSYAEASLEVEEMDEHDESLNEPDILHSPDPRTAAVDEGDSSAGEDGSSSDAGAYPRLPGDFRKSKSFHGFEHGAKRYHDSSSVRWTQLLDREARVSELESLNAQARAQLEVEREHLQRSQDELAEREHRLHERELDFRNRKRSFEQRFSGKRRRGTLPLFRSHILTEPAMHRRAGVNNSNPEMCPVSDGSCFGDLEDDYPLLPIFMGETDLGI